MIAVVVLVLPVLSLAGEPMLRTVPFGSTATLEVGERVKLASPCPLARLAASDGPFDLTLAGEMLLATGISPGRATAKGWCKDGRLLSFLIEVAEPKKPLVLEDSGSIQKELDSIAACFHEAVLVLQAEPKKGESLSAFFSRAESQANKPPACFASLHRAKTSNARMLANGEEVLYRVSASDSSLYDDGHEDKNTTYVFSCQGRKETAQSTLTLTLGGGK
jgi:hypothetical protein